MEAQAADAVDVVPVKVEPDVDAAHLSQRREDHIFKIRLSILYHQCRAAHLDRWDKMGSMLTALSASAVVGSLLKQAAVLDITFALITAILSLIPLVFNPAAAARRHAELAAEFRRLLADCVRGGEYWTVQQCDDFAARAVELEIGEPPPLNGLIVHCENQLSISLGKPDDEAPLTRWEKTCMNYVALDVNKIVERARKATEKRAEKAAAAALAASPKSP